MLAAIVVLAVSGSLFYRNYKKQQKNEVFIEAVQKAFLKLKERQKEYEQSILQQVEKTKQDSIYNTP
ncbi:hypothetical protein [uncultured Kordia sp.]|uniref:hypothetical protein n=1 Tax=uncultured Kordia sp. TaxID=507699 RepID=UPI002616140B|nr:hypothetical protein [uncultured Kordia sp.]